MKINWFIAIGLIALGLNPCKSAALSPLTPDDVSALKKRKIVNHVLYEMYLETDDGIASVFGYSFDFFVTPKVFATMSIFGAVGGERGGYGIAAFGGGYRHDLTERISLEGRLITGSGGGGGLPAGGGLAIEGFVGPSIRLTKATFFDLRGGYLWFPNGTFKTPVVHFGLSYLFHDLFLPVRR